LQRILSWLARNWAILLLTLCFLSLFWMVWQVFWGFPHTPVCVNPDGTRGGDCLP